MCKQNKLEMAGQKKMYIVREAVDPKTTNDGLQVCLSTDSYSR